MKIMQAVGMESTFTIGYSKDKEYPDNKCLSLIFLEIMWNLKTRRWGIGIGILFVYSIGIFF